MTREELKSFFYENLSSFGVESARFEANQLATYTDPEKYEETLKRRLSGEPLQYILGEWEFFGITLKVGEGVLIPRADTETVAETGMSLLRGKASSTVFDLCAGSGCVGIALSKFAGAKVSFFEKSPKALEYLRQNVTDTQTNAQIFETDVLMQPSDGLMNTADMIISNPPYIRSNVVPTLSKEVAHEPKMALDGGEDGLTFYRSIAKNWKPALKSGGYLVFEIGFDQGAEVTKILKNEGYGDVTLKNDLCGNPRVVYGKNI